MRFPVNRDTACEIWGSHSGITEDSGIMICATVGNGREVPTFRRIEAPSSPDSRGPRKILLGPPDTWFFFNFYILNMKASRSFETSRFTIQRHSIISETVRLNSFSLLTHQTNYNIQKTLTNKHQKIFWRVLRRPQSESNIQCPHTKV